MVKRLLVVAVLWGIATTALLYYRTTGASSAPTIATAPVTRGDIVERVDATGGGTATPGATISGDPR